MNTVCVACYSVLVISLYLYPRYQTLSITYKHAVLKEFESYKQYINRCDATE
jgi:hypothetical protein